MSEDLEAFQATRPALLALAYRMLGELGRAEDIAQEAWLRWQEREVDVQAPREYLLKVVTRLCLNELTSARSRREESRSDRLPEPVDLRQVALGQLEVLDQVSMAFLVMLQRLKPVERAVLILHDVFELEHSEIAQVVQKSAAACRQVLRRARHNVALERRDVTASPSEHRHLLAAFVRTTNEGKLDELLTLLAEDAVMIADGGPDGVRFAGVRNLPKPLLGAEKIAAFLVAVASRPGYALETRQCELNGQPALVALRDGTPIAAILLGVSRGRIQSVFLQADPDRLRHLGTVARRTTSRITPSRASRS